MTPFSRPSKELKLKKSSKNIDIISDSSTLIKQKKSNPRILVSGPSTQEGRIDSLNTSSRKEGKRRESPSRNN